MNIDNLRLRTKMLIPLVILAVVVLGMALFGSIKLSNISGAAGEIIERRDMSATRLTRASREMLLAPYDAMVSLVFDGDSAPAHAAAEGFSKAVSAADADFEEAIKLAPDKAAEIGKFRDRFQALAEKLKQPLKIGMDTPGIEGGSKTKGADLDAHRRRRPSDEQT